ncbi:MAG: HAMP domain-containing protein [Deltaproteobacteria bacterium]|nr:HAMP domain-containing protein [Deltaproteobacteria bacterium]
MKLTLKYPLFIIAAVALTGGVLTAVLTIQTARSLEQEITKRGLALAKNFSVANAPLLLAGDKSKLQLAVHTLLTDQDVVDVTVVDHKKIVVAAKTTEDIGQPYADFRLEEKDLEPPDVMRLPPAVTDAQSGAERVFGFIAPMKFGDVPLGALILTLSRRSIEQTRRQAAQFAILIAVATAVLISLGALVFTRRELRILGDMQRVLDLQTKGQFNERLPSTRKDELGDLARAFNRMSDQVELFFHYLDQSIVDRLLHDPSLAKPGGRLQEVAVVFGDMRGYTAMSNRRTAQEVVRMINSYFYLFIEIVRTFQGTIDKTMGDAIMAVFERDRNDTGDDYKRRAVLATAYMKASTVVLGKFIARRLERNEDLHFEPCAFGFAMAAGTAIVGNMGSRHRMDYTVCGRVVNLASRLEKETSRGEVVIDNFTRMSSTDLLLLEVLPTVQPKGFTASEKVTPHRVIGLNDQEITNLRRTLKHVFSQEFFKDHIVPEDMDGDVADSWVHDAQLEVIEIIAGTSTAELFSLRAVQ